MARDILGDNPEYRIADSLTRVQIMHVLTKTTLQVRSSNAKETLFTPRLCPLDVRGIVRTTRHLFPHRPAFNGR